MGGEAQLTVTDGVNGYEERNSSGQKGTSENREDSGGRMGDSEAHEGGEGGKADATQGPDRVSFQNRAVA